MNRLTSTAIVALVAGSLGFAAFTPAAFAQQAPRQFGQEMQLDGPHQMGGHHMRQRFGNQRREARGPGRGGLLNLVCSENGAERLEIAFVRLSHRLDLTAEQTPLFDDLRTAALTAQTQFAESCTQAAAPATAEATPSLPNPVERLSVEIANDTARLELLNGLLPKLEAFYGSLNDTQKASLQPARTARQLGMKRPGQPDGLSMPDAPAAPGDVEAPSAPAPTTQG